MTAGTEHEAGTQGPPPARVPPASASWRRPRPRWSSRLSAPLRCLPDFLVIGAQRSGTTFLFQELSRHPAVWMPPCKECHHFTARMRSSLWYRAFFLTRAARRRRERACGRPVLVGEGTPYYLVHPAVPARVARLLPAARLVVLLRDPVERAYSHYRHEIRYGREHLSFEEALDAEPRRIAGERERLARSRFAASPAYQQHSYVERGRYAEQLERWFAHFDRSQVLVVFSEHLYADPASTTARVEEFLGLPPGPEQAATIPNPGLELGPMADETRRRLRAEFAESDRALERLLGVGVPWPRS
ncbi:MAG: sulfotransferase domain-containing protein [Planctomycetes bacterium]|nr:sulfotransferase domain-containing protein [Planctomycetota bacterium]